MKRIIHEVPRWSVYLHRQARGLRLVEADDSPARRFEDELFERLYAGELVPLVARDRDQVFGPWAERVHDACGQLPAFERLASECRGDADAAATAAEALLAELKPEMGEPELRRAARAGCGKATEAVEELHEAAEGLEHVRYGHHPGTGSAQGRPQPSPPTRTLAARLKNDPRLRRIAHLAGRLKRIAAGKRRSKVRHGADDVVGVEQGGDLARLLPVELAKLAHPRLRSVALRDLIERQALQYRLEATETLGRGPLVVAIDKSGSMEGQPDIWATAVALALLDVAHRERRPFALLGFDGGLKYEVVVSPGESIPEDALFVSCDGGTNIDAIVARGLDIIAQHAGALRKADIVIITDGDSSSDNAQSLRGRAASLGVTILGIAIGIDARRLAPWCDEVHGVVDVDGIDGASAEALFTR